MAAAAEDTCPRSHGAAAAGDQVRGATGTEMSRGVGADGERKDSSMYEQKISELEKELAMYRSREAAVKDALQSADDGARKNAEALLEKAGVDSSSVCSLQ